MTDYLLIESRDPFESNDVGYYYELARGLVDAGNQVTLFLVQNAVLAVRPMAQAPKLQALVSSGVRIFADDFSLGSEASRSSSTASKLPRSIALSTTWKLGTKPSGTRRLICPERPLPSHSWMRPTSPKT